MWLWDSVEPSHPLTRNVSLLAQNAKSLQGNKVDSLPEVNSDSHINLKGPPLTTTIQFRGSPALATFLFIHLEIGLIASKKGKFRNPLSNCWAVSMSVLHRRFISTTFVLSTRETA